ncbi:MAG: glutamate racemase [Clostridia bacterium]|nr:glutamate racemase [Clostridia bacterium]
MQIVTGGIGFFDSGIGGLNVLRACVPALQDYTYYYYGDTEHAPYGNLKTQEIFRYTLAAFEGFERLNVQAAVVACNTATAVCIDELRARFSFPIVGTEPALFTAAKQGGRVLVLCTRATYESIRFQTLCNLARIRYPNSDIKALPCDGLAGAIERANLMDKSRDFSAYFPKMETDSVVLGCTHYSFVKDEIETFYNCPSYDGNEGVVARLKSIIKEKKGREVVSKECFDAVFLEKSPFNPLSVYFLSTGKMVIKTKYEQMFGIKNR